MSTIFLDGCFKVKGLIDPICTVLIVEDNPIDREQYRRSLLADLGRIYNLLEAESISEGLSLYRSNDVDAILLDYLFPNENGFSFLEALHGENNGSRPPVIMVTGAGNEQVAIKAMKLGAEDYLSKLHLTPILLQETMRSTIEKATLRRQLEAVEADRRQAEIERDRFFDLSIDLMAIASTSGYFLRLNPAWEQTLGFTNEELMAQPYLDWIHPDDRAATLEAAQELRDDQTVVQFENRCRCKDGSYRWLSWSSKPYTLQNSVYAIAHDITEQKQAELILRKREETIQAQLAEIEMIYSTTPIGLCSIDLDFRFVRINEHLANINGVSIADHIGRTIRDVLPDVADQLEPMHRRVIASREPIVNREVSGTTSEQPNVVRDWLVSYYPKMLPDDRVIGINCMVQEITDRKKILATLEERNQELYQFAHVVSHDLKAPLRAVSNLSQWIEDDLEGLLTADTQYQMTLLRSRVDRMATTIDDLLNYACIGQSNTIPEEFSVTELLCEVLDSLAPPPTFNIVISPNLPTLTTYRLHLFQVFANLIGNAICHHDRSDGSIHISSKDCGDLYEFTITDDGPGIEPENHEKIFAIFQSINPQNSPDSTGIGLSIVKKIVETEGGTIRLESQLGQGATFYFTWPCPGRVLFPIPSSP